jgi:hypothetical protein
MKKLIAIFFLIIGSFMILSISVNAEVQNSDIVLTIAPENPGANQNVTATLTSHATNLDKSNISWSLDGKEMDGGIGKKSFSFTTGNIGSPTVLTATINTIDGTNLSKTLTISGADVDLLWEAYDSYTPPFYRGKALVPSQGTFKVVAIPDIVTQYGKANINNLSYTWTKDDDVQPDSSGWGKSSFIFQNSYLDKGNDVAVKVSDISGDMNASQEISLSTTTPAIIFYKNDPSYGVEWENSLNDGSSIDKDGETIVAEPYFFSPKDISSPDLNFDWFLNDTQIQTPDPKNTLSIKPDAGQSGNAVIKVSINNVNTLFQSLEKTLDVSF